MRLLRPLVALAVAAALVLVGLTALANGRPSVGKVYDTEARGPKITIDGRPQLERAPQFRIRVGDNSKSARWVQVNPVQYASCSEGDRWNGTLCSKLDINLTGSALAPRRVVLLLVALTMVTIPIVAAATGKRRD